MELRLRGPSAAPGTAGALVRSALATVLGAAATAGLARATATAVRSGTDGGTVSAGDLEHLVVGAVTAGGALAGAVLTLGCLLLTLSSTARAAGRGARLLERAGAALTPRVVRRVLVLGLGGVLGAGPAAAADPAGAAEVDLGWSVSSVAAGPVDATADDPAEAPATPSGGPGAAAGRPPVPTTPGPAAEVATPPPPVPIIPGPAAEAAGTATHVVVPGDSLWSIAAHRLGAGASDAAVAAEWPRWYAANADVIGGDPDLVLPGQELVVPTTAPVPNRQEQP